MTSKVDIKDAELPRVDVDGSRARTWTMRTIPDALILGRQRLTGEGSSSAELSFIGIKAALRGAR